MSDENTNERHLTMPEFSRATGIPIYEVKEMVLTGDLPFSPGPPSHRDQNGDMQHKPMISQSQVARFQRDPERPQTMAEKHAEVVRSAAANRDRALPLENASVDPAAQRQAVKERLLEINEEARDLLRRITQEGIDQ
jgi:hypothetical protein